MSTERCINLQIIVSKRRRICSEAIAACRVLDVVVLRISFLPSLLDGNQCPISNLATVPHPIRWDCACKALSAAAGLLSL